jgi:(E)-4-hydroxy-3-methylbut-2-enyl-diphosphate synthase
MGCIVNGPGEMADADYGYVGAGPGKVVIYKGKNPVKKDVDASIAVDVLMSVIEDRE